MRKWFMLISPLVILLLIGVWVTVMKAWGPALAAMQIEGHMDEQTVRELKSLSAMHIVVNKTVWEVMVYDAEWRLVRNYPMTASSGVPGPKRREGDGQIPEGVYRTTALNPQSKYHLSIRLNYPNEIDVSHNGTDCGSDIYIHGSNVTVGCVPIGDEKIEELFYAVQAVGLENVSVYIYSEELLHAEHDDPYVRDIYQGMKGINPLWGRPD